MVRGDLSKAASQVQSAIGQLQAVQGLSEMPQALAEVQGLVEDIMTEVKDMALELQVREAVLPRLLARLTGRSVEDVLGIEAELKVLEYQRRMDLTPEQGASES